MPAVIPLVIAAVGAYTASRQAKSGGGTQTTTSTLDPSLTGLQGNVQDLIKTRLGTSADLSGYQNAGIGNINHTFDLLKQTQDNNLTARGLAASPIAANVDATRDTARGGQIAQLNNSLPLLQRDMQAKDLGLASALLGQGRGTSTTTTPNADATGSALGSLGPMLAYLYSSGAFGDVGGGGNKTYQPGSGMPLWATGGY